MNDYPTEWVEYEYPKMTYWGTGEAECYEIKLAKSFEASGSDHVNLKRVQGSWVLQGTNIKPFGLQPWIRQIKEYKPPKKKQPDPQHRESVRIEHWDKTESKVCFLTVDYRAVYTSSKGRYIKTRSEGRVYLTSDNPPYIKYVGGRKV